MTEQQTDQSNLENTNEEVQAPAVENQNDDGTKPVDDSEKEHDYKAEAESLRAENERIKQQKLNDLTNPNSLSQIQQRERAQTQAKLHNTTLKIAEVDDESIDGMSLSQYDRRVRKIVSDAFTQITNEKVKPIIKNQQIAEANKQIAEVEGKYDDFWDYQVAMTDLTRVHPGMSADQAYKLAKAEAGGLNTVDEKAIKEKAKKEIVDDSKAGISAKPGLTVSGTKKAMKKMTAKEAATEALEEQMKGR